MKKNVLWLLFDLLFLIFFNVLFFVLGGTDHPASVWISYGFIHFAYIMVLITPKLIRKSSSAAVFGFSLYTISSTYFLIAFLVGILFIMIRPESYKASLVVQIILVFFYLVILFSHLLANEHTADSVERHEMELQYVKESSVRIKGLMSSVEDRALKKKMERAYDLIHGSPVKSNPSAKNYEANVMDLIEVLAQNVRKKDLTAASATVDRIIKNAEERNLQVRLGN